MRLLLVSAEFPPYVGGAGTYTRDLAVGLARSGHPPPRVVTLARGPASQVRVEDEALASEYGIRVDRGTMGRPSYLLALARGVKSALREQAFDGLVLTDAGAMKAAALFPGSWRSHSGQRAAVFHAMEPERNLHDPSLASRLVGLPRRIMRLLERQDVLIAVSEASRVALVERFPSLEEKFRTVHHGIDTRLFEPLSAADEVETREQLGLPPGSKYILVASRLDYSKGVDRALRLLEMLGDEEVPLHLVIAGAGPAEVALREVVSESGVKLRVVFAGATPRRRLRRLYGAALALLQLNRTPESFGLSYLEANATGTITIASNGGGAEEAVEHGRSGYLVDAADLEAVAALIRRLLRDPPAVRNLEAQARKRVLRSFSCETMAENTVNALKAG